MSDIIKLLPGSVANQIAAGEVIQRPASVVKELVENAVDSGATEIKVVITDSGKTMIQVADNGCGMSPSDALLAFERHATSKISTADDLFALSTKGFRGEALASIAAVAMVELKTARCGDESGTLLTLAESEVKSRQACSHTSGTVITVKNLFYNVPARRKFLKKESTELRHIITEFQKIALSHPEIRFRLVHNDTEQYNLPAAGRKQRIVNLFGRTVDASLVPVSSETSIISISGFAGKPEFARKRGGEQFFFINNRYMRHPYFHKAVTEAYSSILPPDSVPSYFIYLTADPCTIDVNIHPTKSEVKFEDEKSIWKILHAAVRESLGRFNISPAIDFKGRGHEIDIPIISGSSHMPAPPDIETDSSFNPFHQEQKGREAYSGIRFSSSKRAAYERLLFPEESDEVNSPPSPLTRSFLNLKSSYIMTAVKSGVMVIDQRRAHERILYEELLARLSSDEKSSQTTAFPVTIGMGREDVRAISELQESLRLAGFEIVIGSETEVTVKGYPEGVGSGDIERIFLDFAGHYRDDEADPDMGEREMVAKALAAASAIPYGRSLLQSEMEELFDRLFACRLPNYSPSGKPVVVIVPTGEIEQRFR